MKTFISKIEKYENLEFYEEISALSTSICVLYVHVLVSFSIVHDKSNNLSCQATKRLVVVVWHKTNKTNTMENSAQCQSNGIFNHIAEIVHQTDEFDTTVTILTITYVTENRVGFARNR